jgi:S1-C subfamily serine protease
VPAAAAAASNAAAVAGAAVTTIVAMQSLRKDFGVGGMPIAATADQTGRSGVLIIAVNGGSVAQKAGIIIGDIVYEFDGRPVKTPAELQAAITARAANTPAALKLYRGTTVVGASAQFAGP